MRIFKKSTKQKIISHGETFHGNQDQCSDLKKKSSIPVEISYQYQGGKLKRYRRCRIFHKVRNTVNG